MSGESLPGDNAFFQSIASGQFHVVIFEVSRADCNPERNALSSGFGKLQTRRHNLTSETGMEVCRIRRTGNSAQDCSRHSRPRSEEHKYALQSHGAVVW